MEYQSAIPKLDWCKGSCGLLTRIVNVRYTLCDDCNYKRLHQGRSKVEVYKERHEQKQKDKSVRKERDKDNSKLLVRKKGKAIRPISIKKAERDKAMYATYNIIDQIREPICEGCGRSDRPLSHSHLLSQHSRTDLAADSDNIRLHCFGNFHYCHEKWERCNPEEIILMDDFRDNLSYIQSVDEKVYNKIVADFEFKKIAL